MAIDGKVVPGKSQQLKTDHFTPDEVKIVNRFAIEWYVTHGGGIFELGMTSTYKYFVICPTEIYKELFNIEREILVIFSNYETFESRSLIAFDHLCQKYPNLRIEKICYVLISKDKKIEDKITDLIKRDPENQVIIPFYFDALTNLKDNYYLQNQFKKYFFSRDLFAFKSPLRKDLYFFGRTDLVHKIVNRHRSNESSGIFGLRKTGKTSLVFGVQRVLKKQNGISAFIDCQDTSFHMRRWNKALHFVSNQIKIQNGFKCPLRDESDYTEENASLSFESDLIALQKVSKGKNILIIFDEIERITYKVSPSEHWKTGLDFVFFWQTIRSIFQKNDSLFTYLIVGTNPRCVETSLINGQDNPIYGQIPYDYIPPFDVLQTKEMVKKLGRFMGLVFDEPIFSKLTEDFGGHPFLIRTVCSAINEISDQTRPVRIDNFLYERGKEIFNKNNSNYIDMILTVLKEYFNDEYQMLTFLSTGDYQSFMEFAGYSNEYTNHLLGYNILDENAGRYSFKIASVKQYLENINKFQSVNLSGKEMLSEISERRNTIEPKLRKIVKQILQAQLGISEAKNIILDIMGGTRKQKYSALAYKDLFNPNEVDIYLEDLRKIINTQWPFFEFVFERDKPGFENNMEAINKYRADAHAKIINADEFKYFRVCISKIEKQVDNYLE